MTTLRSIALSAVIIAGAVPASAQARYGADPAAGHTFVHDGVRFYYEVYGIGEPLLLVHGNGGSIADWRAQIDFFRERYRVIAMDSRSQGRSGDGQGAHLRADERRPRRAARASAGGPRIRAGLE